MQCSSAVMADPGKTGRSRLLWISRGSRTPDRPRWGPARHRQLAFGARVIYAGLPALPRVPLSEVSEGLGFSPPYIVKPRFGGSSIGIEVVADFDTAQGSS